MIKFASVLRLLGARCAWAAASFVLARRRRIFRPALFGRHDDAVLLLVPIP